MQKASEQVCRKETQLAVGRGPILSLGGGSELPSGGVASFEAILKNQLVVVDAHLSEPEVDKAGAWKTRVSPNKLTHRISRTTLKKI